MLALGLTFMLVGCTSEVSIQQEPITTVSDTSVETVQPAETVQPKEDSTPQPVAETVNTVAETSNEKDCYNEYSGNQTPLIKVSFEYPCTWTVPLTGGKVTSPDGTAVLEYPAPDVGLPNEVVSSGNILINGQNYQKTIYKNGDIFVEYINLGTAQQYDLSIIFHYTNIADRASLYHILETFKF